MTKHGRRYAFMKDLAKLLTRHRVSLTANDFWEGWAECGQDVRITAEFDDWTMKDVDLGRYVFFDELSQNVRLDKLKNA